MFIELTEALACPVCLSTRGAAPAQGLVAVVDALRGRRVVRGYLGCVSCESRFPILGGVIDFRTRAAEEGGDAAEEGGDAAEEGGDAAEEGGDAAEEPGDAAERAVQLAALLGLDRGGGGYLLLSGELAPLAAAVARLAGEAEVLVMGERGGTEPEGDPPREDPYPGDLSAGADRRGGGVTHALPPSSGRLPVLSGRFRGVALEDGTVERLGEAARALAPGGRLVVFRPGPALLAAANRLPFRVLAAEERALVAVQS